MPRCLASVLWLKTKRSLAKRGPLCTVGVVTAACPMAACAIFSTAWCPGPVFAGALLSSERQRKERDGEDFFSSVHCSQRFIVIFCDYHYLYYCLYCCLYYYLLFIGIFVHCYIYFSLLLCLFIFRFSLSARHQHVCLDQLRGVIGAVLASVLCSMLVPPTWSACSLGRHGVGVMNSLPAPADVVQRSSVEASRPLLWLPSVCKPFLSSATDLVHVT